MTTHDFKCFTSIKEHTDSVLWTIPACLPSKFRFNNIQASCSNTDTQCDQYSNYELKIKSSPFSETEIYFLSRVTRNVKFKILFVKPPKSSPHFQSEYCSVQAHKWQYLTSITNNLDVVVLKFEFTVNDKNSVLQEELRDNIAGLLNDELFSDAVMKSADGVEYKVHKAILATRSSVFKANFTHKTTESVKNIIKSPFGSEVLFEVLNFIYSSQIPKIREMPEKLLVAADFYQLANLKKYCEMVLCYNLTMENVIENLQLAELYSLEDLKKGILEFVMDDKRAYGITKTEAWAKLASVTSIKFLYENVTKHFFMKLIFMKKW